MILETLDVIEIFPWNENFETGIATIDDQHRQLVMILNGLAMHLANRASAEELNEAFVELADYANYHFRAEEAIWSRHFGDDEAYRKHIATHHSFIDEVLALKENETHKGLDDVIHDIVAFLSKWLAYHILDTDKRMAKTITAMDAGSTVAEAKAIADEAMGGSTKLLINTVLNMYESLSTSTLKLMREKALRLQAERALSESEERWKVLLEGGVEDVWDLDIASNGISHSEKKPPLFELMGRENQPDSKVSIHPADIAAIKRDFDAHLKGETEFFSGKYRVIRENGNCAWFLTRGKVVSRDSEGRALRMVGTHSDITERELASQIFQNSSQAMHICDMNNRIININPAFTKITGYTLDEVVGQDPKILSSRQHDKNFFRKMWQDVLKEGHWRGELNNRRKNGELYPQLLMINTIKGENGEVDHYFAIFDDITEKKKADELIFEQANFDPLTKLPNRRMFFELLEQEIKHSNSFGFRFALLFVDLDNFKDVNDTLGHETGDMLLLEASERIVKHVGKTNTVAQLGGDKFAVIVSEVKELAGLDSITQDLIDLLSRPYRPDGHSVHSSASIGITLYPDDAKDASTLLKHAEQAMYQAKNRGRNCYGYFMPTMQEEAQKRHKMLNALHRAQEAGEFEIYYQPIIDLNSGTIRKAEALIRWHHPEEGMISPEVFIPLAEESGLIITIGDWVYREATRQALVWQQRYDANFQISVNKSPLQFREEGSMEGWIEHLETIGMPGRNSVVEITESFLMESEGHVAKKLAQLREKGVEISLDDFGTGYSSLAYLQKFKIDYVKIDKGFVSNLTPENALDTTLCEAIVTMAHKLNIRVIAEGVETPYQHKLLQEMECDYGQGYLFSRPVPSNEFEVLLRNGVFGVDGE